MNNFRLYFCIVMLILGLPTYGQQQQNVTPTNDPNERPIKILTEEVQLSVTAQNEFGHFDPTLVKEDLLIVENGVPQTLASLGRTPANVVFLLDTGLEFNRAKNTFQTGITAEIILRSLQPSNYFSIIQYNDKVETIANWTNNRDEAVTALRKKLFAGKRSRLVAGVNAAIESFKSKPPANRHLVLITDGIESVAQAEEQRKAFQNLLAANINLHIISYTQLEEQKAQKATQRLKVGDGKTKPRLREEVMEQIIAIVPDDPMQRKLQRFIRTSNQAQKLIIFEIDGEWIKRVRRQREAWRESESRLKALSEETGGTFQAPEDVESMLLRAREVAQTIDSQYIVTYIPKRAISEVPSTNSRQIKVVSRRVGLRVRAKQKIILSASAENN